MSKKNTIVRKFSLFAFPSNNVSNKFKNTFPANNRELQTLLQKTSATKIYIFDSQNKVFNGIIIKSIISISFSKSLFKKDNYIKLREEQITLGLKLRKRSLNTNYYFNLEAEQKDHHIVL